MINSWTLLGELSLSQLNCARCHLVRAEPNFKKTGPEQKEDSQGVLGNLQLRQLSVHLALCWRRGFRPVAVDRLPTSQRRDGRGFCP